ncbi:MAG: hypothetical protein EOO88_38780 [Pedobacter sp.]|nr:MAG: hypothetical protein EOO88_38780 [Pedobacter sp.]
MKKLISFAILFFIVFAVKAQSEAETLEWLRTKQQTIRDVSSDVIVRRNGKLTIDLSSIKVSNAETSTNIPWNKVKDVTVSLYDITIVSNELVDGKNAFIRLTIDSSIAGKYSKALRHMATLKGAKMVKDDLF